ncbi:MAG: DUF4185 domain-containing protein [Planctomycetaceae bacterium]
MLASLLWLAVLCAGDLAPGAEPPPAPLSVRSVRPAPEIERLFDSREGWIGADAIYSIPLPDQSWLWVFGDTLVGTIRDGRRHDLRMVNNSFARQRGFGPEARVELLLHRDPQGQPASFLKPANQPGYFWIWDGLVENGRLYLLATRLTSPGTITAFDWTLLDQSLLVVDNPLAPPAQWRTRQVQLPCGEFTPDYEALWGLEVLRTDSAVLVFGTARDRPGDPRRLVAARVDPNQIDQPAEWQFWSRQGWQAQPRQAAALATDVGTEGSLTWLPKRQRWVYVYSPPLDPRIQMRTAQTPLGPWSEPVTVHTCPEPQGNPRVFSYAAKARQVPGRDDELLVSYATNSLEMLPDVTANSQLYQPRFLWLELPPSPQAPPHR